MSLFFFLLLQTYLAYFAYPGGLFADFPHLSAEADRPIGDTEKKSSTNLFIYKVHRKVLQLVEAISANQAKQLVTC
jgi:hypothetical protein